MYIYIYKKGGSDVASIYLLGDLFATLPDGGHTWQTPLTGYGHLRGSIRGGSHLLYASQQWALPWPEMRLRLGNFVGGRLTMRSSSQGPLNR
jgi:hypothetical protein